MPNKKINELVVVDNLPNNINQGTTYSIAQANPNTYTHIYFKYPCRFIPEIPRWAIKKYLKSEGVVFDPFAGSGTAMLEGIILNHEALGAEIDEIAKVITKAKTTGLSKSQLNNLTIIYENIIKSIKDNDEIDVYCPGINNLEHWFNTNSIITLGKLKTLIVQIEDASIRNFMLVCFLSIIKKVSNADDISPKPYVSRKIKKNAPEALSTFMQTFERYYNAIVDFSNLNIKKQVDFVNGDALNFKLGKRVDIAITSPPYINAFDYARTLRLENLWAGMLSEEELRCKKKYYVGTETLNVKNEEQNLEILNDSAMLLNYYSCIFSSDKKRALVVKKFFEDMKTNLIEVKRNLKNNGYYVIVIGNSNIRGVNVESWRVLEEIAHTLGYKTDLYFHYIIKNPYIRIPRSNRGGIISKDTVLVLKSGEK